MKHDDPGVEWFLDLDGSVFFIDEKCKYRIMINAKRTDVTPECPHGLNYSLTLHDSKNERILGFDNAHPVPANKGPSGKKHKFHDHKHRKTRTVIYKFTTTEKLLEDFWISVDQILAEKGIKK
jgi:Family of unknown function (DUF6516)